MIIEGYKGFNINYIIHYLLVALIHKVSNRQIIYKRKRTK